MYLQWEHGWRTSESAHPPPKWLGFDSRTRRHMWLEFVVGCLTCSEGFSPGYPVFLPPHKPTFLNSNSTWNARTPLNEFLELFGALWVNKSHLHHRRISAIKQWKPLCSSQSKKLTFFEFFRVSPGAHPLTKKPEDYEYEIKFFAVRKTVIGNAENHSIQNLDVSDITFFKTQGFINRWESHN